MRPFLVASLAVLLAGCSGPSGGADTSYFHDEGEAEVAQGAHKAWPMDVPKPFDLHPRVTNLGGSISSGIFPFDAYFLDADNLQAYVDGEPFDVVQGTDGPCSWEGFSSTAAPCRDVPPGAYTFVVDNTDRGATASEGDLRLNYEIDARDA